MDIFEVMRTAGATREFRSDPVSDEAVYRVLDNARFAPSGGNRQGWRVIVVRDPVMRTACCKTVLSAVPTSARSSRSI